MENVSESGKTSAGVQKNTSLENFQTSEELNREHFFQAMRIANGNKTLVAKLLGITIKSVYNKMERYYSKAVTKLNNETQEEGDL